MNCDERREYLEEQPVVLLYSEIYNFLEKHPELGQPSPDKLAKPKEELIEYLLGMECNQQPAQQVPAPPVQEPIQQPAQPDNQGEYVCPYCGRKFKSATWLTRHIRQYHPEHAAQQEPPTSKPVQPVSKPVPVQSESDENILKDIRFLLSILVKINITHLTPAEEKRLQGYLKIEKEG